MKLKDAVIAWQRNRIEWSAKDYQSRVERFKEKYPEAHDVLIPWYDKRWNWTDPYGDTYRLGFDFHFSDHLNIMLLSYGVDWVEAYDDCTRNTSQIRYSVNHVLIKPEQFRYIPMLQKQGLIASNPIKTHSINFYELHEYELLV